MPHHVLLADEDARCRRSLAENLIADGYTIRQADDRDAAAAALRDLAPDVIVADVNGQTLGLLDWLRDSDGELLVAAVDTPMIVLSARGDEIHRIRLLEHGADDVLEKPYSYPELRARLTAVLRRTSPRRSASITVAGPIRIDRAAHQVTVNSWPVCLSETEFRLLSRLASEPMRVFTRQELLRDVWGYRSSSRTRTLDTHAHRVRAKLRAAGAGGVLQTVWAVGYRLLDSADTEYATTTG
jgi:DNA-binding response OmpR family regulator